ncbi:GNAT family N-acetyltransferase [Streptomyces sp. NPDC007063]|uniref:GNAT family N-acetyltransferase n=1 Tax=Streptomyces sp. NPDC007063 TaxID=3364772 RepID=UPI00367F88B8
MFTMRPATGDDTSTVKDVILARSAWLEERGRPTWRDSAEDLAAQASKGYMWVLESDSSGVIGCTTLQEEHPPWGWTPAELAQPALYLYTTATHPDWRHCKPGTLIAFWAVDHAARNDKQWVRRGCFFPGLVRYYETQGFHLAHEVVRTHHRVYLMARQAQHLAAGAILR